MEKGSFRLGIKMKIDNRLEEIPEEFKKLAEEFGKKGFITTSFDNLVSVVFSIS